MPQAIHISPIDNVVVALHPIAKGTLVEVDGLAVTALEDIPQGHKMAVKPIKNGENVKTKFYKGSNSVRGSGIGLALVDSIMTALDGTMDIKSTLGRGTVVTLGLPLYKK